ncbi:MAG: hypothetical protein JWN46_3807 [Acidimicrobiales bacterium]|nr:hypothetical protein [Acidimicrobiales bacterium]
MPRSGPVSEGVLQARVGRPLLARDRPASYSFQQTERPVGGDHDAMPLALIPETVIDQRSEWTLAVNRNQNLLGKLILGLRRPSSSVTDVSTAEWASLRVEIQRATSVLDRCFRPDQFNFAFLMNVDPQVHLHVLPRYATARRWHGREFTDPDWGAAFGRQRRDLDPADLKALADEIRAELHRPA